MTSIEYAAVSTYRRWVRDLLARMGWWLLLLPPVVFVWRTSHFQYDIYLPGAAASITATVMLLLAVVTVAMIASLTWFKPYARPLAGFAAGYAALVLFHSALNQALTGDGKPMLALQSAVFSFLMLPIISDRDVLLRFLRLNFALGLTLVALNTVTVLHWLGFLSLPHHHVRRVGGEDLYAVDPFHFGLFGLTESYAYPGHPVEMPRLQGFSLEPIHWAYFVFLTLSSGLFVFAMSQRRRVTVGFALAFALVAAHLFFVFSAAAMIATAAWLAVLALFAYLRRGGAHRRATRTAFLAVVLAPGFLMPFVLARIPSVSAYLVAEDVLNKGTNWDSKIGFLSMGNALYTRFLPTAGDIPAAGHNLVLSTYLQFGYFLTIPLLVLLAVFLRRMVKGTAFAILAAGTLAVLSHLLVVPTQLFYPSGAMWLMMGIGVAYHARQIPRTVSDGH